MVRIKDIKMRILDCINIRLANLLPKVIGIKQKSSVAIWDGFTVLETFRDKRGP